MANYNARPRGSRASAKGPQVIPSPSLTALAAPSKDMPIRITLVFDCSPSSLDEATKSVIDCARSFGHPRRCVAENVPQILEFDV